MIRVVFILAAIAFVLSIWLISMLLIGGPWSLFNEQGALLTSLAWGRIALVDLYAGFFITLTLIAIIEPRRWVTALLIVSLPILGNPVVMAWVILRHRLLLTYIQRDR